MILWILRCLHRRPALYAREPFLEERLETVGGHWRFAHTAGGLPSLIASVLSFVLSQDYLCDKEEDHARRITDCS